MIINTIIDYDKQRITLTPLKYKGFEKYVILDESIKDDGNYIKPTMVGLLTNRDVLMLLDRLLSINYLGSDVRDLLPKNVGMLKEHYDEYQEDY